MATVSQLASLTGLSSIIGGCIFILACYLILAPSSRDYLTYGLVPCAIQLILGIQRSLFGISPALLIYSYVWLKIYQTRLIKRIMVGYLKMNHNKSADVEMTSAQEPERNSMMMMMRSLLALKGVTCLVEAADRHVWGKIFAAYLGGWFMVFTRTLFVGILSPDQPLINRAMILSFLSLMYPAVLSALGVAGLFVKECRSLVPHLTRLAFAWPQVS